MTDAIDASTPAAIYAAIQYVNRTPGLRIEPGRLAMIRLFKAPGLVLTHDELKAEFNLNAHFGWFCRHVAIRLGVAEPREYALCDESRTPDGRLLLTLKPSVVKALATWGGKKP